MSKRNRRPKTQMQVVEAMVKGQLAIVGKLYPGLSEQEKWLKAAARTRRIYIMAHKK